MGKSRNYMPSVHTVRSHWEQSWGIVLPIGKCWCCHRLAEVQRAHIVAVSRGGGNEPDNLLLTCRRCNWWVDGVAEANSVEVAVSWVKACQRSGRALCPPHPQIMAGAASTSFAFTPSMLELDDVWARYIEVADDLCSMRRRP